MTFFLDFTEFPWSLVATSLLVSSCVDSSSHLIFWQFQESQIGTTGVSEQHDSVAVQKCLIGFFQLQYSKTKREQALCLAAMRIERWLLPSTGSKQTHRLLTTWQTGHRMWDWAVLCLGLLYSCSTSGQLWVNVIFWWFYSDWVYDSWEEYGELFDNFVESSQGN